MAARRVTKSAVDWAKFASLVPKNQVDCYKAFKTKSDMFSAKVHKYPENLPKIDFAAYRAKVSDPAIVDALEKAYSGVSVPYPKDKANVKADVEAQEKQAMADLEKYTAESKATLEECQLYINKVEELPHLDEFTHEMYVAYFGEFVGMGEKPSIVPYTKIDQPGGRPDEIRTNFLLPKSLHEKIVKKPLDLDKI